MVKPDESIFDRFDWIALKKARGLRQPTAEIELKTQKSFPCRCGLARMKREPCFLQSAVFRFRIGPKPQTLLQSTRSASHDL